MNTGTHEFLAQDRVIWGKPAVQAVVEEADRRGARRVFIVTSKTLNRKTDAVQKIRDALGARHVGTFDECQEHTPRASVIAAAAAARAAAPDLVLTFGGCTDTERHVKDGYAARYSAAAAVILDPAVTAHTPEWLWLSTAIRAVDHAVEGICSIQPSPLVEATSLHALHLLGGALERSKADPADMDARLACLQGAWLSGFGILRVPYGASHGMGHSLGAVTGMSHGYTSCIMLPHVMRWNFDTTRAAQTRIAQAMGRSDGDAPQAVADLVARLGLPTRLRDLGTRQDQFGQIARGAAENMWVRTNPRSINGIDGLLQLLQAAW